jgi:catechol 2,3-dioxygenase-like lactoylglutathione lyase family enzyme
MAITLNHTIVPARDKRASARFFAGIFGLTYEESDGYFAPVGVNDTLTLDFDDDVDTFDAHHYAFHVSDPEFNEIFHRIKGAKVSYGSDPWNLKNGQLNSWNGGRGFYILDPNGHILEVMTRAPDSKMSG